MLPDEIVFFDSIYIYIYIYIYIFESAITYYDAKLECAIRRGAFRGDTWRTKIRNADTTGLKIMQRPCGGLDRDLAQLLCHGITAIASKYSS